MTREKLQSLSYKDLFQIADNGNINVHKGIVKEELISVIIDAFEDERLDREHNNNLTIKLEAKKYLVGQNEELFLDFTDDIQLPERYEENCLILMLRDPSWIYCYWDIQDRILQELYQEADFTGLFLRITELSVPDWGKHSPLDCFEIPIQFEDLGRYINLPNNDSFYGGEIFSRIADQEEVILRSNVIESSRHYIAAYPNSRNNLRDKLIQIAGLSTDIGSFPGSAYNESENPHRIITAAAVENPV